MTRPNEYLSRSRQRQFERSFPWRRSAGSSWNRCSLQKLRSLLFWTSCPLESLLKEGGASRVY